MAYPKTLAMKLLDGKKVPYEVIPYPEELRDAEEIARMLGVPAGQVFKTLVVLPPGHAAKPILVMLPADRQLDLKKLAKVVQAKKFKMATHAEAEALTGLQVGGISALALMNKRFANYLDKTAESFAEIYISAGKRGLDIKCGVEDLLQISRAQLADVGRPLTDQAR